MSNWLNFERDLDSVPHLKGVYLLADVNKNIVYAGQTDDLHDRLMQHPDPKNPCLQRVGIYYFAYEINPNSDSREDYLISHYKPTCNIA
jgi:excinuclease UvrABC nuclease subunit